MSMETGASLISLDRDTIAVEKTNSPSLLNVRQDPARIVPITQASKLSSPGRALERRTDGDSQQRSLSHPTLPSSSFSSQLHHTSDTLPQPYGVQPLTTPPSTLLSYSAETNDGLPAPHFLPLAEPSFLSSPADALSYPLLSTASSAPSDGISSAAAYFGSRIGSKNTKRINNLVRATQGFIASNNIDQNTMANLLTPRMFDGPASGPISRLQRLSQGLTNIRHPFVDILGSIFFAFEVGQVAGLDDFELGRGQSQLTGAFLKIAAALGIQGKDVIARYKKSRNYMLLLKSGGPGLLLQIGAGTGVETTWHHRLVKGDVDILVQYLEEGLQDIYKRARSFDKLASQILVDGMVAYGCSYHELAVANSMLLDCIRLHVDLDQLAQDMEGSLAFTQPFRHPGTGEGSGFSDDGTSSKRRYDDANLAERPVKRVQPAQGLEEADISTTMWLSPVPGEPDISTMMWLSPVPEEPDISTLMRLLPMGGDGLSMQLFGEMHGPMMQMAQPPNDLDVSAMLHRQQIHNSGAEERTKHGPY